VGEAILHPMSLGVGPMRLVYALGRSSEALFLPLIPTTIHMDQNTHYTFQYFYTLYYRSHEHAQEEPTTMMRYRTYSNKYPLISGIFNPYLEFNFIMFLSIFRSVPRLLNTNGIYE
jgi:hypothetical protein